MSHDYFSTGTHFGTVAIVYMCTCDYIREAILRPCAIMVQNLINVINKGLSMDFAVVVGVDRRKGGEVFGRWCLVSYTVNLRVFFICRDLSSSQRFKTRDLENCRGVYIIIGSHSRGVSTHSCSC